MTIISKIIQVIKYMISNQFKKNSEEWFYDIACLVGIIMGATILYLVWEHINPTMTWEERIRKELKWEKKPNADSILEIKRGS